MKIRILVLLVGKSYWLECRRLTTSEQSTSIDFLLALSYGSDVKNMLTAMQSMVNQGELDGLQLLQGYIKDLKSYNTEQNNHEEQELPLKAPEDQPDSLQKSGPNSIKSSPWPQYDENVDDLIEDLMEEKNGKYNGKIS